MFGGNIELLSSCIANQYITFTHCGNSQLHDRQPTSSIGNRNSNQDHGTQQGKNIFLTSSFSFPRKVIPRDHCKSNSSWVLPGTKYCVRKNPNNVLTRP